MIPQDNEAALPLVSETSHVFHHPKPPDKEKSAHTHKHPHSHRDSHGTCWHGHTNSQTALPRLLTAIGCPRRPDGTPGAYNPRRPFTASQFGRDKPAAYHSEAHSQIVDKLVRLQTEPSFLKEFRREVELLQRTRKQTRSTTHVENNRKNVSQFSPRVHAAETRQRFERQRDHAHEVQEQARQNWRKQQHKARGVVDEIAQKQIIAAERADRKLQRKTRELAQQYLVLLVFSKGCTEWWNSIHVWRATTIARWRTKITRKAFKHWHRWAKKSAEKKLYECHMIILRKYIFKTIYKWRLRRKNNAMNVIHSFLQDWYRCNAFTRAIRHLVRQVRAVQRVWRLHKIKMAARMEMLVKQWDRVEDAKLSVLNAARQAELVDLQQEQDEMDRLNKKHKNKKPQFKRRERAEDMVRRQITSDLNSPTVGKATIDLSRPSHPPMSAEEEMRERNVRKLLLATTLPKVDPDQRNKLLRQWLRDSMRSYVQELDFWKQELKVHQLKSKELQYILSSNQTFLTQMHDPEQEENSLDAKMMSMLQGTVSLEPPKKPRLPLLVPDYELDLLITRSLKDAEVERSIMIKRGLQGQQDTGSKGQKQVSIHNPT
eukprot:TRINITY_DN54848_c0_g1_i1.p1 TRINITY_DN54848_c0_g1~~TRINITY_DN54848_c0_g1_i1.p1  ORF type:complete len:600 (-),score=10.18 TRINITY_DN54848_c0_g1_i1:167-1966(-)